FPFRCATPTTRTEPARGESAAHLASAVRKRSAPSPLALPFSVEKAAAVGCRWAVHASCNAWRAEAPYEQAATECLCPFVGSGAASWRLRALRRGGVGARGAQSAVAGCRQGRA